MCFAHYQEEEGQCGEAAQLCGRHPHRRRWHRREDCPEPELFWQKQQWRFGTVATFWFSFSGRFVYLYLYLHLFLCVFLQTATWGCLLAKMGPQPSAGHSWPAGTPQISDVLYCFIQQSFLYLNGCVSVFFFPEEHLEFLSRWSLRLTERNSQASIFWDKDTLLLLFQTFG